MKKITLFESELHNYKDLLSIKDINGLSDTLWKGLDKTEQIAFILRYDGLEALHNSSIKWQELEYIIDPQKCIYSARYNKQTKRIDALIHTRTDKSLVEFKRIIIINKVTGATIKGNIVMGVASHGIRTMQNFKIFADFYPDDNSDSDFFDKLKNPRTDMKKETETMFRTVMSKSRPARYDNSIFKVEFVAASQDILVMVCDHKSEEKMVSEVMCDIQKPFINKRYTDNIRRAMVEKYYNTYPDLVI